MNTFNFCKMHGLGNDFLVIDGISQQIDFSKFSIPLLAHRHLGIGFDQLLLIKSSQRADFYCEIFNSDGSRAEQCGNGMRCVARFVHENHLTDQKTICIETISGIVQAVIHQYERIEINMGHPRFEPSEIPFNTDQKKKLYELNVDDNQPGFAITALSLGNPHAILQVSSIGHFPVTKIGPLIAGHPNFPQGVNVGFMEIISSTHIRLRTFERGAGETFACGTNACAAVVAGILNNQLDQQVNVELSLGRLEVKWEGEDEPVILTGPATQVFSGHFAP